MYIYVAFSLSFFYVHDEMAWKLKPLQVVRLFLFLRTRRTGGKSESQRRRLLIFVIKYLRVILCIQTTEDAENMEIAKSMQAGNQKQKYYSE